MYQYDLGPHYIILNLSLYEKERREMRERASEKERGRERKERQRETERERGWCGVEMGWRWWEVAGGGGGGMFVFPKDDFSDPRKLIARR